MTDEPPREWQTRVAAATGVTLITVVAMVMQIDGAAVPIVGSGIVAGIAGYATGFDRAARFLSGGGQ